MVLVNLNLGKIQVVQAAKDYVKLYFVDNTDNNYNLELIYLLMDTFFIHNIFSSLKSSTLIVF